MQMTIEAGERLKKTLIAVFDLRPDECADTADAVRGYYELTDIEVEVEEFHDLQTFISAIYRRSEFDRVYQMMFIGIDSMLGVEAVRSVRGIYPDIPLILLSNVGDYGMEGFRLHALDYILKPTTSDRIKEAVRRIKKEYKRLAQCNAEFIIKNEEEPIAE